MPYAIKLIAYFLLATLVVGMISYVLAPFGHAVNVAVAFTTAYLSIVLGRWLFGRKNL